MKRQKYNYEEHRFPYRWTLKDAVFTKDKGTVFSCFACGGGSTMGYKLAGFDVLGCNEIDPKMIEAYRFNHKPKFSFLEPIQTFKERDDLPEELYNLDILDGSPPCSSFSMSVNREKDWRYYDGDACSDEDYILCGSFPLDYNFLSKSKEGPKYMIGMSVPPIMTAQIATQIFNQWLSKL